MGIYQFFCDGCSEETIAFRSRKPKFCSACTEFRSYALSYIRDPKCCKSCGVRMLYCEYFNKSVCVDCSVISERRHNGWADPYSKPLDFVAANDNSSTKVCTSCEWELPHDAFTRGFGVCKDCRRDLRQYEDRSEEYARRYEARGIDRLHNKRVRLIERANRKRRAEKRAIGRKIDTYLRRWNDWQTKPWTRPGLSIAERFRLRYSLDIEFRLRNRTRSRMRNKGIGFDALWRMRQSLNGQVGKRGNDTIERALGYTMSDLRLHLESQFVDGMSWDAFREGEIHIDHIRPLCTFDLDEPEQVKAAWALNNLRPLWAADNMSRPKDGSDVAWLAAA